MKRNAIAILSFIGMVLAVLAALKLLHWVPAVVDRGLLRPYTTVDEVKRRLGIKELYLPTYFPRNMMWPPSSILAQSKPYLAVVSDFRDSSTGRILLTVGQSASREFFRDRKFALTLTREKTQLSLKGRSATLEVGSCDGADLCSAVSWEEGAFHIFAMMQSTPAELLQTAESMIR